MVVLRRIYVDLLMTSRMELLDTIDLWPSALFPSDIFYNFFSFFF